MTSENIETQTRSSVTCLAAQF